MNQNQKLKKRLATGKPITSVEARIELGIKNVSARIVELRRAGVPIYTNRPKGAPANYRMGRPSRKMIANAYAAAGAKAFV